MREGDQGQETDIGEDDRTAESAIVEEGVMTAESIAVEEAEAHRGGDRHPLVASQRHHRCDQGNRKDRHPDGIAMDPAGEPVESRNGRPTSSERPEASHFPRAGCMAIASRIPHGGRRWTVESPSEPRAHAA